jgi:hypothetical protein
MARNNGVCHVHDLAVRPPSLIPKEVEGRLFID